MSAHDQFKKYSRGLTNNYDSTAILAEWDALTAEVERLTNDPPGWRCFHCGELFTTPGAARAHFGKAESDTPACAVDPAKLRAMESELRQYRDEDSGKDRAMHAMESAHGTAVRKAEEDGYARGLRDYTKVESERDAARSVALERQEQIEALTDQLAAEKARADSIVAKIAAEATVKLMQPVVEAYMALRTMRRTGERKTPGLCVEEMELDNALAAYENAIGKTTNNQETT